MRKEIRTISPTQGDELTSEYRTYLLEQVVKKKHLFFGKGERKSSHYSNSKKNIN